MANGRSQQQVFEDLLSSYERSIADAFRSAVSDLQSHADLQRLITALQARDIAAAIEALNLAPAAYGPFLDAVQQAYNSGGASAAAIASAQTPASVIIRFDARNLRAEAWLRLHSSQMVTRILDDQRDAVRGYLVAGMERGANPRTTALDLVGRVSKATGKREGGILGLSTPQEAALRAATDELASGDPKYLKAFLGRARRDKRFDASIRKAISTETPLPAETIRKASAGYQRRLLQLRGETIGRTEAMTALHSAQREAFQQAIDSGAVSQNQVRRTWRSAFDNRVRDTHAILSGETVGMNEPFKSASGAVLMFPGDPSAPASEIINCRCTLSMRVDVLSNLR